MGAGIDGIFARLRVRVPPPPTICCCNKIQNVLSFDILLSADRGFTGIWPLKPVMCFFDEFLWCGCFVRSRAIVCRLSREFHIISSIQVFLDVRTQLYMLTTVLPFSVYNRLNSKLTRQMVRGGCLRNLPVHYIYTSGLHGRLNC